MSLDNPLLAENTGLENEAGSDLDEAVRLYDYVNQRESGDGVTLFWDNHVTPVTSAELQELYNADDNGQLREAFGSFDNYLSYMDERQDLLDAGELRSDWWASDEALVDINNLNTIDDRAMEQDIRNAGAAYAEQAYNEQADALSSLYSKYTGEDLTRYNNDGDKYQWNGASFVKTSKFDDSFNVQNQLIHPLIMSVIGAGIGSAVGTGINAAGKAIVGTGGWTGPMASIVSGTAAGTGGAIGSNQGYRSPDFNPNVIVNLAGSDSNPSTPIQTDKTLEQDYGAGDNTTVYTIGTLPAGYIYNEIRGVVINEATGEEYKVHWSPYGDRVWLPSNDKDKGGGGGDTDASADDSSDGGGTDVDNGTTSPIVTGGNDDIRAGDIIGRQIHEAILRAEDPEARARLIEEWERYTGETYSDDYYSSVEPVNEKTAIGHVWVPGMAGEDGYWMAVYDEDEIPDDGVYQQGSEKPEAAYGDWALYCSLYPDDPACAANGYVTGGGNKGDNSASGGKDGTGPVKGSKEYCELYPNDPDCKADNKDGNTVVHVLGGGTVVGTNNTGGTGGGTNGGNGPGNGPGSGPGEGGDGGGDGGSGGDLVLAGGSSTPKWSPLFPGTKFRKFNKRQPAGMMGQLQSPVFQQQDFTNDRMSLLSSIAKDLA